MYSSFTYRRDEKYAEHEFPASALSRKTSLSQHRWILSVVFQGHRLKTQELPCRIVSIKIDLQAGLDRTAASIAA